MRAAVYCRQSLDRTGEELGVARQRESCLLLVRARGWELIGEYVDNDTSASNGKPRPAFERLLEDVRRGKVQAIVARDVDRLCRRLTDLEKVLATCHTAGARVVTAAEGIDSGTDAGRLVSRLLAAVAQGEVERKSRRQIDAQAQAAAQGRRVGGRRPFGYEQDGMAIRPDEARAIRRAYTDLLAGVPLAAIARDWNAAGLRSGQTRWSPGRKGEPSEWTPDTVRRVLRNARNAGLRRYVPTADRRARRHRVRPDEGIVGKAEWPAIVPEETWLAAVALLADPTRRTGGGADRQLLTGLARCGTPVERNGQMVPCGEYVHGGGASHKKPIYRCKSGKHVNRVAAPVDEYVSKIVVARLRREDARDLLLADDDRPDLPVLRAEAMALRSRLDSVMAEFADDDTMTPAQLRKVTKRIKERLAEVETAMADAGRVDVLGPLVHAEDPQIVWDGMDVDRRRGVIETLMEVRLHPPGRGVRTFRPETVEIDWKEPGEAHGRGRA